MVTMVISFLISLLSLGDIIMQLRYLAEKEFAITVFGPDVSDPENYDDLIGVLSGDLYEELDVLVTCLVNTISSRIE